MTCPITSQISRGFTGQEMLGTFCLINFSYVDNNPLAYTDPTGHDGGSTCPLICYLLTIAVNGSLIEPNNDGIETVVVWGDRMPSTPMGDLGTLGGPSGGFGNGGPGSDGGGNDKNGPKPPCDLSGGAQAGLIYMAAIDALDGAAAIGTGIAIGGIAAMAVVAGCINPTPLEPATCLLAASAVVVVAVPAAGAIYAGVRMETDVVGHEMQEIRNCH